LLGALALGLWLAVLPALRPVRLARAAAVADAAGELGERFTTAVEVMAERGAMARLVVRDATRSAAVFDLTRLPKAPMACELWLLAAGTIVSTALWLHGGPSEGGSRDRAGDLPAVVGRVGGPGEIRSSGAPEVGVAEPRGTLREILRLDRELSESRDVAAATPASAATSPSNDAASIDSARVSARAGRASSRGDVPGDLGDPLPMSSSDSASPMSGTAIPREGADTAQPGGPGRGAAGRRIGLAAGGVSPTRGEFARDGARDRDRDEARGNRSGEEREPLASARAGLARMAVPPALRHYVERYLDELRRTPPPISDEPSAAPPRPAP
jgi:hypothetical protein